jgi:hypothetical protein
MAHYLASRSIDPSSELIRGIAVPEGQLADVTQADFFSQAIAGNSKGGRPGQCSWLFLRSSYSVLENEQFIGGGGGSRACTKH